MVSLRHVVCFVYLPRVLKSQSALLICDRPKQKSECIAEEGDLRDDLSEQTSNDSRDTREE